MSPQHRRHSAPSSSSSSSSSSDDSSDAAEKAQLRAFARQMYAQLNPTESNPNIARRPSTRKSRSENFGPSSRRASTGESYGYGQTFAHGGSGGKISLFRRASADGATGAPPPTPRVNRWKKVAFTMRMMRVFKVKHIKFPIGHKQLEQVQYIGTLDELDDGLLDDLWFTADDLDDMKREALEIAVALEEAVEKAAAAGRAHPLEDDKDGEDECGHCFRGLESKTEEGNWQAYKARKDVVNAVLDEQDRQEAQKQKGRGGKSNSNADSKNLDDEQTMRAISVQVTEPYAKQAVERAERDARVADKLCQDVRRQLRVWELKRRAIQEQPIINKGFDPTVSTRTAATASMRSNDSMLRNSAVGLSSRSLRSSFRRPDSLSPEEKSLKNGSSRRAIFGGRPSGSHF